MSLRPHAPRPLNGTPMGALLLQQRRLQTIISVQRGLITIGVGPTTATATITSVDLLNTQLRFTGSDCQGAGSQTGPMMLSRLTLTNATTVTMDIRTANGVGSTKAAYEVLSFFPGFIKSVQRGIIIGGGTATIASVNPQKASCDYLGETTTNATFNISGLAYLTLTNATTVTQAGIDAASITTSYQVTERY